MCVLEWILRVGIAAFKHVDKELGQPLLLGKVLFVYLIWWSSKRHLFLMLFELFMLRSLHLLLFF